ncbi:hypothetical protein [Weizmannia acidilactici]|uniref:hypothetical protein n=1 Tax=Weizmannia acidilactici TaxID=2607726 RepID=UPI00156218EB|nr:hypothetical protein [Weizmannia acidilactici]
MKNSQDGYRLNNSVEIPGLLGVDVQAEQSISFAIIMKKNSGWMGRPLVLLKIAFCVLKNNGGRRTESCRQESKIQNSSPRSYQDLEVQVCLTLFGSP